MPSKFSIDYILHGSPPPLSPIFQNNDENNDDSLSQPPTLFRQLDNDSLDYNFGVGHLVI